MTETLETIGLADPLNGLFALGCELLRRNNVRESSVGFTDDELHNGLHALQQNPKYEKVLDGLDFRNFGNGKYGSQSLADMLFIGHVLGAYTKTGHFGKLTSIEQQTCIGRLTKLETKYGSDVMKELTEMTLDFLKIIGKDDLVTRVS